MHMELVASSAHVPWAAVATDPPKLRSLTLFRHKYAGVQLLVHPGGAYALTYEELLPHSARVTIYGNTSHAPQPPDYAHAARQVLHLRPPRTCKFSALPEQAVPAVSRELQASGLQRTYHQPCLQYVYAGADQQQQQQQQQQEQEAQLPPGYVLGELCAADAPLVDSLWTFRSATSLALVQELIAGSHTSCIRRRDDGRLVAWTLEVEPLCMGMLYVLEQHRRRSLARHVCLDLFRKLERQRRERLGAAAGGGDAVYAYVVEGNEPSKRLMESLGLRMTGVFSWLGFDRQQ